MTDIQTIFRQLCSEGRYADVERVRAPFRLAEGASVLGDTRLQSYVRELPSYQRAIELASRNPILLQQYGENHLPIAIQQFVIDCLIAQQTSGASPFHDVWSSFERQIAETHHRFLVVTNLQNFDCGEDIVELLPGITVRTRSYEVLAAEFRWSQERVDATLGRDAWSAIGTHVLIVESRQPKSPENVVLANDAEAVEKLGRTLLTLRILRPGFLRTGTIFYVNPEWFSIKIGGTMTAGNMTSWQPGTHYVLSAADVPTFRALYPIVERVEHRQDRQIGPLHLALRAFSSIYSRDFGRSDERLVNAITTVEALLRIDFELSFRSAFRVATMFSSDDEERVSILKRMQSYYDTRSKIVHGGQLKSKHESDLQNEEQLLEWTRALLRGFLHLADAKLLDDAFYEALDATLLHTGRREDLRKSMKLSEAAG